MGPEKLAVPSYLWLPKYIQKVLAFPKGFGNFEIERKITSQKIGKKLTRSPFWQSSYENPCYMGFIPSSTSFNRVSSSTRNFIPKGTPDNSRTRPHDLGVLCLTHGRGEQSSTNSTIPFAAGACCTFCLGPH